MHYRTLCAVDSITGLGVCVGPGRLEKSFQGEVKYAKVLYGNHAYVTNYRTFFPYPLVKQKGIVFVEILQTILQTNSAM